MGTRIGWLTLVAVAAAWPGVTLAQTAYRCTGPDGTPIFSQNPCADDAEEIQIKVVAPPQGELDAAGERARDLAARVTLENDEAACVRRAEDRAYRPLNSRVSQLQRRIADLEAQIARRANNLAGATWEAGMREEIASLHQAIATERSTASGLAASYRAQCAEDRRRREDEARARAESG